MSEPRIVVPVSWSGPSSDDWVIHDPFGKLRDKYFDGGTVLSLEFDLYHDRRMVDPAWANRLEAADLAVTLLMNSRVRWADVDAVLAHRAEIESALRQVPSDLDLVDADLSDPALRRPLLALFRGFRVPGVSVAKATKVLCLKRPRLIPMLDDLVRRSLYEHGARGVESEPDAFAEQCVAEMELFRRLMLWPVGDGRANLHALAELTAAITDEAARRISEQGMAPPYPHFHPVRVLDNLLWFEQDEGYGTFGYVYDKVRHRVVRAVSTG